MSLWPDVANLQALAIDPSSPNTMYAGTPRAGMFKSTDTWVALRNGLPIAYVLAIALDPVRPATIFARLSDSQNPLGVFTSTDGGASWAAINKGFPVDYFVVPPLIRSIVIAGRMAGKRGAGPGIAQRAVRLTWVRVSGRTGL